MQALSELGQDYLKAGLLDRAEEVYDKLRESSMVKEAKRNLLEIYQLEKDWEKTIAIAAELPDILKSVISSKATVMVRCVLLYYTPVAVPTMSPSPPASPPGS